MQFQSVKGVSLSHDVRKAGHTEIPPEISDVTTISGKLPQSRWRQQVRTAKKKGFTQRKREKSNNQNEALLTSQYSHLTLRGPTRVTDFAVHATNLSKSQTPRKALTRTTPKHSERTSATKLKKIPSRGLNQSISGESTQIIREQNDDCCEPKPLAVEQIYEPELNDIACTTSDMNVINVEPPKEKYEPQTTLQTR